MTDDTRQSGADRDFRLDFATLESVLQGLPEGVTVQDAEGRLVYANDAAARSMGLSQGDDLARQSPSELLADFDLLDEAGNELPWSQLPGRRALATGARQQAVLRWRDRRGGEMRWTSIRSQPLLSPEGRPTGYAVNFFRDITTQKDGEVALRTRAAQQEAVSRLGVAALADTPLHQLFEQACAAVTSGIAVDLVLVLEIRRGGQEFQVSAGEGLQPGIEGEMRFSTADRTEAAFALESRGPVAVESLDQDARFEASPPLARHGAVSGVSVAIASDDAPFGVLEAYCARPRSFSGDEVHFVATVANVLASAVQRKRHEDAIRLQTRLLDSVRQSVIAMDLRGRVIYWNEAAREASGWTAGEAFGRLVTELVQVEAVDLETGSLREKIEAGESWSGEFNIGRKDGSSYPAWVTLEPLREDSWQGDGSQGESQVVGLIAVTLDISERKAVEQRLAAQYRVTRLLSEASSIAAVRVAVLQAVCEELDWDAGGWWNLGDTGELSPTAFWSRPTLDLSDFQRASFSNRFEQGRSLPGRVAATEEPAWIEDVVHDENFDRAPAADRCGLHGAFGFPIKAGDRLIGVIEFFSRLRRPRDEALLQAMSGIGGQVGHLIDRMNAEDAMRASEERYRRLVDSSPEAIAVHQHGRLVFLNAAAATLLGAADAGDLIGRDVLDFIHADFQPMVRRRIREVMEEGRTAELVEEKFVRLDGSEIDVEVVGIPTMFGGQPAYQVMARDISERRRAEAARRAAEEQYRALFENAVFGVFRTTRDGRFVHSNQALASMFGYESPEELMALVTDIGAQLHEDPARRAEFARLLDAEGSVSGFEAMARRRDGSLLHVSLSGRAVADMQAGDVAFEGIVVDISARKLAEEQLAEQKRVLETIEQVGASLASELDLGKTVKAVTDAATTLTGARIGALFYRVLDEDGDPTMLYTISGAEDGRADEDGRAIGSGEDLHAAFRYLSVVRSADVTDEGAARPPRAFLHLQAGQEIRSYLAVPVLSRSGEVLGGLFLAHDRPGVFSDHHEALAGGIARWAGIAVDNAKIYQDAQLVQQQLREANEAKDEFLGLVSHELRTPITTIYGGARLLQSRADRLEQERKEEILADIEQESERLFRLIEDLLALARLELGAAVGLRPVLFQRVMDKVLANFTRRRPSREVINEVPDNLPAIQADATYIEQIMRNLLGNADKYSPMDQPIVLSAETGDEDVVFKVMDRGPGLTDGEIERVFERFYRAEKTARQAGGLGIGLTVCRRLVEAQSGTIWAEPRDGGGLVMAFTVPISTGEPEE